MYLYATVYGMKSENILVDIKNYFEETGYLSSAYLMRKYKITSKKAHDYMKDFVKGSFHVIRTKGIISKVIKDSFLESHV